jgi:hypothetical protein
MVVGVLKRSRRTPRPDINDIGSGSPRDLPPRRVIGGSLRRRIALMVKEKAGFASRQEQGWRAQLDPSNSIRMQTSVVVVGDQECSASISHALRVS